MPKDWGFCHRCGKPSQCQRYCVEVGDKEAEVCEPCWRDFKEAVKRWADGGEGSYLTYPGERRPVVVQAHTQEEAEVKVRLSPEYDGFMVVVYAIEEFAKRLEMRLRDKR